jgi:predicted glycosyltransferase
MYYLLKWKPNIAISSGSIPLGFACKLNGIPNIQISDDPERIVSSKLEILVATKKFYPPFVDRLSKKTGVYNCLKQWAYLTPAIFQPNESVLMEYSLQKKEYLFIRDVSLKSLNYSNQEHDIIQQIVEKLPKNLEVVLSLEDKSKRSDFPENWILLREPVSDIHSLMYFSKIVISTGDSMVREGALLGVPSIYLGHREMAANTLLINKKILFKADIQNFKEILEKVLELSSQKEFQENTRNSLFKEWDDLNSFMIDKINTYKKL